METESIIFLRISYCLSIATIKYIEFNENLLQMPMVMGINCTKSGFQNAHEIGMDCK